MLNKYSPLLRRRNILYISVRDLYPAKSSKHPSFGALSKNLVPVRKSATFAFVGGTDDVLDLARKGAAKRS